MAKNNFPQGANTAPLDSLFSVQAYDDETNVFAASREADKKSYLGSMWIGEPMVGMDDSTLSSIQSMLATVFPAGTLLQFLLLATPDVDPAIDNYVWKKRNANPPVLKEMIKRHAELHRNGAREPIIPATGVLLSKRRIVITMKCEFSGNSQTNLEKFREQLAKLESGIKANNLPVRRASPSDLLMIVRLMTHIYSKPDASYDDEMTIAEQVFYAGDEVTFGKDYIQFNTGDSQDENFYASAMSPKKFPREFHLGMMNLLIGDPRGLANQLTNPYAMVLNIYYPEQIKKKDWRMRKHGWIKQQLFGGKASGFMPGLSDKNENFNILQQEIETNSAILVEASFTLWLYGRSMNELYGLQEGVRTYWSSMSFDMKVDKLVMEPLFTESLPLNGSYASSFGLMRTHTMTSSQATQFLPIIAEYRGSVDPVLLLLTRRGEIGGFDLYKSPTNYNAILAAESGAGKSFWTQALVENYLAEGAKVWVIDQGRSYQKLAAALGGTFMEFSPQSDIVLNPFTSFAPERGGSDKILEDEMDFLARLLERMGAQREPFTDLEIEWIKEAIRSAYTKDQYYIGIKEVAQYLADQANEPRKQDLARRLDTFANGQYARYFNGTANVDMGVADFVVLELDDLKNQKQLQQVVLLQLVNQITNEMYLTAGRKKVLIVDEAWALLDDPIMGKAMEMAFRQARKYDGSVLIVTQGIADLYNSEAGKAMVANAQWKLLLKQKPEAIDQLYNSGKLQIDEYSYSMLKTVKTVPGQFSEVMIIGEGSAGIFRLVVDPFTAAMFSTTGKARTQVLADIENGMDVVESIQRLMVEDSAYQSLQDLKQLIDKTMRAGRSKEEIARMMKDSLEEIHGRHEMERA